MATEKRLIDVNPAHIQAVLAKVPYYTDEIWKFTAMTDRFPTVDAVEVVHSRWKRTTGGYDGYICSNCESVKIKKDICDFLMTTKRWNFCPNCGAKMDGGNEENES